PPVRRRGPVFGGRIRRRCGDGPVCGGVRRVSDLDDDAAGGGGADFEGPGPWGDRGGGGRGLTGFLAGSVRKFGGASGTAPSTWGSAGVQPWRWVMPALTENSASVSYADARFGVDARSERR